MMHLQSRAQIRQLFQRQGKQWQFGIGLILALVWRNKILLQSQKDPNRKLGQMEGPSQYDIDKIRKMYNCKKW